MRGDLYDEIVTVPITETSRRPIALNEKSHFGKLTDKALELSLIEAAYLMKNNRLDIYKDNVKCEPSYIINLIKERDIYGKFLVYSDLKNRGYVIKTGFKYGSEFRLYERGLAPGKGHSNYLVKVVYEKYEINALDFASYVRVAHGVNKNLLLAVVDDDLDITYYNIEWTRP
ncbi:tRNA-intron lyase [Methanobrevibacter boviskoreani]|uniref:tRNA-intron lyase n=1 Tax=Methanobrevibacter boviskoreani TaxID=1348249 RepID=UPI0023A8CB88|nr:tRNA-intron lyase [Methanobrevibacter boviskoreani]MCI6774285.1 tRNA-intron lyase [Methanobrevibacter boviskoreani]MDY5614687.1 tRNA-intron lyase [Methanobrevibacter boviskoreani]